MTQANLWNAHQQLAKLNSRRLNPRLPHQDWRAEILQNSHDLLLEGEVLEFEISQIEEIAAQVPNNVELFMEWFENLKQTGPGQNDPLFDWLAEEADLEQMRWFIKQEVAGEAGFEDLTALTQVKFPTRPKLEMARNYWDEMGRGNEKGMHGPMLAHVAREIELKDSDQIVVEAIALANVLTGFASNRRYAYHSAGALGAIELTAPGRAAKVYQGLKRLGLTPKGQQYYLLHASVDIRHSVEWNKEVIRPLIEENIEIGRALAEGALVRLNAGARCFERYKKEFGLNLEAAV